MQSRNFNIVAPLRLTAARWPDRLALREGRDELSYRDFAAAVARLAGFLKPRLKSGRVGILGTRSTGAYVGLAAAAWAGGTYVPLNLKWPAKRLVALMQALELDAIVADKNGARLLEGEVLEAAPKTIIRTNDSAPVAGAIALGDVPVDTLPEPVAVGPGHTAYIIFTSGSTGLPKGVVVSAGSLARYVEQAGRWALLTEADRIAEAHDITFDLSVHNMFLAWEAGASLHLMSALDMMAPQRFVRAGQITCWMSVPTIAAMMRTAGALKPGIFPDLRLSVFCGEPLPVALAESWAEAAPNSTVENIYGPTECTVTCMRQRLTRPPVATPGRGILAIGTPFENFAVAILDAGQQPVPRGTVGEIALSSEQLADGYFNAPEQTADRFREIDGRRWYLTGDLGFEDESGIFHHMGRADNQVKLKGNRVELDEVEVHLRRAAGTDTACVVAWPMVDGSAQGLVAFVAQAATDASGIRRKMEETLQHYMVPQRIELVERLPQTTSGKLDRRALIALLEEGAGG